MKVPFNPVGRTRLSSQPLAYLDAPTSNAGQSISAGLTALAAGVRRYEERQEQQTRFTALSDFSEFETQVSKELTDLKRDQAVDVANFPDQAAAVFRNAQNRFVAERIPPELQAEFRYRTDQVKQRVIGDALDFQYKSQDAYFTTETAKQYDKARLALSDSQDPDKDLEVWQGRMAEFLLTADLPEQKKAELAREMNIGLQAVVYKRQFRDDALRDAKGGGPGRTQVASNIRQVISNAAQKYGVDADTLTTIAWLESRGNPNAENPNSSAGGLFQQTNGNAKQYGVANRFDAAQSAEGAAKFLRDNIAYLSGKLGRAPTVGELYLAHQQGPAGAAKLLSNPSARAVDVVGAEAVRLNGGNASMTAGEFANLWIKKAEHAAGAGIDTDARFAAIPYDQRVALQNDAAKEAQGILNAEAQAAKDAYDARFNTLMNGVQDGTAGMADINAAYNNGKGWLSDYDDRMKAVNAWEKKNEDAITLANAQAKLASNGAVWDPTSTDDKKFQNLLFGRGGAAALAAHDMSYVGKLAAMAARTKDIPTDAVGMLTGMSRATDIGRAMFAYNALAMLQDYAPEAYESRVDDKLASRVDYWRARKDTMPEEELMQMLRGGMTAPERQQRTVLRKEGEEFLRQKVAGVPNEQDLVADFLDDFNSVFTSNAGIYNVPWAARGLNRDFHTAFIDAYENLGNVEDATEAAKAKLRRTWGVTEIGGQKTLMKYPPEAVGYPQFAESHDWIDAETRKELGLKDDDVFQLISDEQSDREFDAWKGNPGAPSVSYMVAVKGPDGWALRQREQDTPVLPEGKRLVPYRIRFEMPEELKAQQELEFRKQDLERRLFEERRLMEEELNQRKGAGPGGIFPSEDLLRQREERMQGIQEELDTIDPSTAPVGSGGIVNPRSGKRRVIGFGEGRVVGSGRPLIKFGD